MSVNLHVASGYKARTHTSQPFIHKWDISRLILLYIWQKVMCYSKLIPIPKVYSICTAYWYLFHLHGVDVCLVHKGCAVFLPVSHLCDDSHTHQSSNPKVTDINAAPETTVNEKGDKAGAWYHPLKPGSKGNCRTTATGSSWFSQNTTKGVCRGPSRLSPGQSIHLPLASWVLDKSTPGTNRRTRPGPANPPSLRPVSRTHVLFGSGDLPLRPHRSPAPARWLRAHRPRPPPPLRSPPRVGLCGKAG